MAISTNNDGPQNCCDHYRTIGRNGYQKIEWTPKPCPAPTRIRPGTPERVELYAWRMWLGMELHHPDDVVLNPEIPESDFVRMLYY